jgi:antitoxin CcdA
MAPQRPDGRCNNVLLIDGLCAYNAHTGEFIMKPSRNAEARKRPVNLTLNEDLVVQAKQMTDNLSGVVESLLSQFVVRERGERLAKSRAIAATLAMWNEFNAKSGSIADEYSSL